MMRLSPNLPPATRGDRWPSSGAVSDADLEKLLANLKPTVRVFGCGGGGSNTVQRLFADSVPGAELIALNTDAQHLLKVQAHKKVLMGRHRTRGLGAGADPQVGEESARESGSIESIKACLEGSDLAFITCGLGGGTGTGSAPVVAEVAHELGILTIVVATLPFRVEGEVRRQNAQAGLDRLKKLCDTVITIPNDKLLELVPNLPLNQAFRFADDILARSVRSITELVTRPGLVNLDFADLRTVLADGGVAMVGFGESNGERKAKEAAERALSSPLLDLDIATSRAALVNVSGGEKMTLGEAESVARIVHDRIDPSARIIWGAQVDPGLGDLLRVMVVLSGVTSEQMHAPREAVTTGNLDVIL
ncbi:MAG: cell division protein FtsZ [Halobacteria archaeon]